MLKKKMPESSQLVLEADCMIESQRGRHREREGERESLLHKNLVECYQTLCPLKILKL